MFNREKYMRAMVFESAGEPLVLKDIPIPLPSRNQALVKVIACGVCRTDLHVLDGDLKNPKFPLIPGHEIVGLVMEVGESVTEIQRGDFVGIPWLGYTCGQCKYCLSHHENLCENALFTGYTIDGGFAEFTVVDERYCFRIPRALANPAGAPLLCAGLIGYRSYNMIDKAAKNIGLYGFGAAAHILIQIANHQHKKIFAFTRDGDEVTQEFARKHGAVWVGNSSTTSPVRLDGAIIFAPVGNLVPKALIDIDRGGVVVCAGIHMSNIPSFPYEILWEEREIRSVANLTRQDGIDFFRLIADIPVKTDVHLYKLEEANNALDDLRHGRFQGAAVLVMDEKTP